MYLSRSLFEVARVLAASGSGPVRVVMALARCWGSVWGASMRAMAR